MNENIPIDQLRVDERYWPKGASEVVRRWLAEDYRPATMPALIVNRQDDGNFYVLGWEDDGRGSLFKAVYGRAMNPAERARARNASR